MKKILAVLVSVAMLCGICLSSFAEEAVEDNLDELVSSTVQTMGREMTDEGEELLESLIENELTDDDSFIDFEILTYIIHAIYYGDLEAEDIASLLYILAVIDYFDDDDTEDVKELLTLADRLEDVEFDLEALEEIIAAVESAVESIDLSEIDEGDPVNKEDLAKLYEYLVSDEADDDEDAVEEFKEVLPIIINVISHILASDQETIDLFDEEVLLMLTGLFGDEDEDDETIADLANAIAFLDALAAYVDDEEALDELAGDALVTLIAIDMADTDEYDLPALISLLEILYDEIEEIDIKLVLYLLLLIDYFDEDEDDLANFVYAISADDSDDDEEDIDALEVIAALAAALSEEEDYAEDADSEDIDKASLLNLIYYFEHGVPDKEDFTELAELLDYVAESDEDEGHGTEDYDLEEILFDLILVDIFDDDMEDLPYWLYLLSLIYEDATEEELEDENYLIPLLTLLFVDYYDEDEHDLENLLAIIELEEAEDNDDDEEAEEAEEEIAEELGEADIAELLQYLGIAA